MSWIASIPSVKEDNIPNSLYTDFYDKFFDQIDKIYDPFLSDSIWYEIGRANEVTIFCENFLLRHTENL